MDVNPDGTRHAIYYGNNTNSPGGIIDPRPVPDSKLMLCIFGSCHDRPWGALALIDRSRGVDGKEAVVKIWPEHAVDLIGKGDWDTFMKLDTRYEDPFPLSQTQYLVSRSIFLEKNAGRHSVKEKMGIYLLDLSGNEILIHEDDSLSCFDPIPLLPDFDHERSPLPGFLINLLEISMYRMYMRVLTWISWRGELLNIKAH